MQETMLLNKFLTLYGDRVYTVRKCPKDSVFIGRGKNSVFGNPFFMKSEEDRISVCLKYLEYIKEKANNDESFKKEILNLKGKTVCCFCSNGTNSLELGAKYCHGHVLLAYSEYLLRKEDNVTQKV